MERDRFHLPLPLKLDLYHTGVTESKSPESPVSLAHKHLFSQDSKQALRGLKWAGETAQLVRCSSCKHKNRNSISRLFLEVVAWLVMPVLGRWAQTDPRAHWPASLAYSANSKPVRDFVSKTNMASIWKWELR